MAKTATITPMDASNYDQETGALLNDCLRQLSVVSPKAPATIRKLLKKADVLSDNALRGFAYYHQALYVYYTSGDSTAYRPHLEKAMRCLLRSDETDYIARAYNFIAVDAHNNGCLDVAYNYYMTALRFAEQDDGQRIESLVSANIGRLYSELGYHDLARKYIRRGLKAVRKHKGDLRYYPNLIIIHVNDGITSVALGDLTSAGHSLAAIEKLLPKAPQEAADEVRLPVLFLRIRLSLALGDKRAVRRLTQELCALLKAEPLLQEFIDDIRTLAVPMIASRMLGPVGQIIDAVDDRIMSCDITHVMRMFSEIRVDYYDAKKDGENLRKSLYVQHRLLLRQREEQQKTFKYSMDLIALVNDLWQEQEKIQQENTVLQKRVQTDTLTGIPNRYMMNKELEAAFERAYQGSYALGVGILDIDYFKEYNDTYGHQEGDHCLEKIAGALQSLADEEGIFVARYGGDEFVLLYENRTNRDVLRLVKNLEARVSALHIAHKASPTSDIVTISQGICNRTPRRKNKLWDYLSEADAALYAIKKGRGQVKHKAAHRLVHD